MRMDGTKALAVGGMVAGLATLVAAMPSPQSTSLVVSGMQGSARVAQVGGRNYVELEGLARITSGSVSYNGRQIVLTLPSIGSNSGPGATQTGLSQGFVAAAVEATARIREWHAALRVAVRSGAVLTPEWLSPYRGQAEESVGVASAAATTPDDKSAFSALQSEFGYMDQLSGSYLATAQNRTFINPDKLDKDPADEKVRACYRTLAGLTAGAAFGNDASCQ